MKIIKCDKNVIKNSETYCTADAVKQTLTAKTKKGLKK